MAFLSNAFNDPSNPWYYVIGVLFLVLIFAAVGVYVYFNAKRSKNDGSNAAQQDPAERSDTPEQPNSVSNDADEENQPTEPETDNNE